MKLKQTFIKQLGFLHNPAGALFLTIILSFIPKEYIEFDTVEHIIGAVLFCAATYTAGFLFGWLGIEEPQKAIFGSEISWNDAHWTASGCVLALIYYFSVPQEYMKVSAIVSAVLLVLMGVGYVVYRKVKNV